MQLLSINRETGNLAKHFISGAHRCINFSTCVFINEIQRKMISFEKLIVSCIKIGNAFNVHKTYFVIVSHPPKCRQRDFSQHSCIETDIVSSTSKVAQKDFSPQLFAVFDFIQIILNSMNAVTWGYLFIPTRDLNFRPYNFALFESSATYECKWYSVQNKGIRFPFSLSSGKRQCVFLSKWYYRIIVHRSQKNQWRFGEYKNMRKRIEQTICYQSYFMI